ncbi:hypothetical protein [Pedobacter sp. MR22-3]|uniref:hypothetical protein n=1 Tax=Pedobacter sp. MR22-3 TaxID=2994552 RepID=UPI002246C42B|nr:hypothetical protein [Pedobacter sp. MR22-3]MCX2582876.1 hypothetical protein [Pedobacter sp. MR22-3]
MISLMIAMLRVKKMMMKKIKSNAGGPQQLLSKRRPLVVRQEQSKGTTANGAYSEDALIT